MSPRSLLMTRRSFLGRLGQVAGSSTMLSAMQAMGLTAPLAPFNGPPQLAPESGKGRKVVIVGSGIAGLTAAFELGKAGYECLILEATNVIGGRNRTLRHGDRFVELDSSQVCDFDDRPDLYMNAGPARLPYHHRAVLGYCKEFGVALEPFLNVNRAAWLHDTNAYGGQRQRLGAMITDSRGYVAELLAKALSQQALDQPLTAEDSERLMAFVSRFGDLAKDHRYLGSTRGGVVGDDIMQLAQPRPPGPLAELLKSDFWDFKLEFGETWEQGPTMMQPVGGMDRIVQGFRSRVGHLIRTGSPVTGIFNTERGVRVRYQSAKDGPQEVEADFCIDGAPTHIVTSIENNFSDRYRAALAAPEPGKLFKIAFQGKRRFWEEDDHIYGGVSWTDQDIMQIWYPSHGFQSDTGVLLGSYTWDADAATRFALMTPEARLKAARQQAEKLHPGFSDLVSKGISVAWQKVPYLLGCASVWTEQARAEYFPVLLAPEGAHYMVGDQISYQSGWQEGAVRSAYHAIEHLHQRAQSGNA